MTTQAQALLDQAAALLRQAHPEVAEQLAELAQGARVVPGGDEGDYYTCIGKDGLYEFVGRAKGAGTKEGSDDAFVYRSVHSGQLFYRCQSDFSSWMVLKNVAPVRASAPDLTPAAPEVAQHFQSDTVRFDRATGRFVIITADHPIPENQVSKTYAEKHRSRFMSARTIKGLLLMTQPAED